MNKLIKLYDKVYKRIGAIVWHRFPRLRKYMPDRMYLMVIWDFYMDYPLNLRNPKTFNEKLQWLKLYNRKPIYTKMVDKVAAKEYVASIIGDEYIIPTLGVYDRFDEIDFDKLPNQFVLKATHDSGGVYICKDKKLLDKEKARAMTEGHFGINVYNDFKEWPYKDVKPRIIAEKYLEDESGSEYTLNREPCVSFQERDTKLTDYKFYCFNGVPKCLYISKGMDNHATAKISFLSIDWTFAPFKRTDYDAYESLPPKPLMFDDMVKLAKSLAESHPFIRVDLYQSGNKIYFGELTFFPCAGYMPFAPLAWDLNLGEMIKLPIDK